MHDRPEIPVDDEERRLVGIRDACHATELNAAARISHPNHRMLFPEYKALVGILVAIRLQCNKKKLAVIAHRQKMRDATVRWYRRLWRFIARP